MTVENVRLPRPAKVRIERAHKSPTARVYINDVDASNHVSAVTWGMKAGKLPTATLTFLDVEVDVEAEELGPGSENIRVQSTAPNEGLRALAEANKRECARIVAEVQDGGLPDFTAEDWERLRRFAPGLVDAILGATPVERRKHVVSASEPAELRTPVEWGERYGVDIMDPDGWRSADAPAWTEPITLADFYDRARRCTVRNCATVDWQRIARDAKES